MRIRKNPMRVVDKTPFLFCQLNRAPWHDHSFFTQGDWDNGLPLNVTSNDSIPTSDSEESMELSFENAENTPSLSEQKNEGIKSMDVFPAMMSPREARNKNQAISFSPAPLPPKKAVVPATATFTLPKKRGRPRKPTQRASHKINHSSDPGYVYYWGFGPSWGKKRGGTKLNPAPQSSNGIGYGIDSPMCSSTTKESSMSDDDIVRDVDENKGSNMIEKKNGIVEIKSFGDVILAAKQQLDYIEDDEDDELYDGTRARKLVKARSLKSLM